MPGNADSMASTQCEPELPQLIRNKVGALASSRRRAASQARSIINARSAPVALHRRALHSSSLRACSGLPGGQASWGALMYRLKSNCHVMVGAIRRGSGSGSLALSRISRPGRPSRTRGALGRGLYRTSPRSCGASHSRRGCDRPPLVAPRGVRRGLARRGPSRPTRVTQ